MQIFPTADDLPGVRREVPGDADRSPGAHRGVARRRTPTRPTRPARSTSTRTRRSSRARRARTSRTSSSRRRPKAQDILNQLKAGRVVRGRSRRRTPPTRRAARRAARSGASPPASSSPAFETAAEAAPLGTPVGPGALAVRVPRDPGDAATSSYAASRSQVLTGARASRVRRRRRPRSTRLLKAFEGAPRPAVRQVGPHPQRAGPERLRGDAAEGTHAERRVARARPRRPRATTVPVASPGASTGTP